MHDDRVKAGVGIEPELENRQARERRDPQALRVVEHHALHGLEVLLVQEQQHEVAQTLPSIGAQAAESRARLATVAAHSPSGIEWRERMRRRRQPFSMRRPSGASSRYARCCLKNASVRSHARFAAVSL